MKAYSHIALVLDWSISEQIFAKMSLYLDLDIGRTTKYK